MAKNHVNYGSRESQACHLVVCNFPCYNFDTQTRFSFVINTFMWELIEMAIDDDSTQEKLLHILTWNVNKLRIFFQTTYFCGNDENCQSWSLNKSIKTNSIDVIPLLL